MNQPFPGRVLPTVCVHRAMGKSKHEGKKGAKGAKGGAGASPGGGGPKHSMDPGGRPAKGAGSQRSEATVRGCSRRTNAGYPKMQLRRCGAVPKQCPRRLSTSPALPAHAPCFFLLQVRRLAMYKQRPVRDAKGKVLFEQYQSATAPNTRIVPDRRWFGNTRVVGQAALEAFRTDMAAKRNDAYNVVLKQKTLPLALLEDSGAKGRRQGAGGPGGVDTGSLAHGPRSHVLTAQPFASTFGLKAQRKRPAIKVDTLDELLSSAAARETVFQEAADAGGGGVGPGPGFGVAGVETEDGSRPAVREALFSKGQSKRIWGELYKVVDSSDVIIQVLDVRDPVGTRCAHLEAHLKTRTQRHRTLILLLNKCDLVPAWVTRRWLHALSREHPTVAFHASVTNPFGRGALLSLLRQLGRLHQEKAQLAVGFVGYPNVGKSSVINALRGRKVCVAAPQPGETKVWQYINLTKKICLIDCPGVVWQGARDTDTDAVLKGVVRISNLGDPTEHVAQVLARVKPEYIRRAYKVEAWTDANHFLTQLAQVTGKLLKGGEPDLDTAAKGLLQDWQRGRIPYFAAPPPLPEGGEPGAAGAAVADAPALAATATAARRAGAQTEAQAQQLVATAAAVTAKRQSRRAMPAQRGRFDPDDEVAPDGMDDDLAFGGREEEDEEDGDDDVADDDEEGEEGEPREAGPGGDSDGDSDSDGYGELTWDAVVQDLQGGAATQPGGKKGGGGAAAPAGAQRAQGKGKRQREKQPEPQLVQPQSKRAKMGGKKYTSE